MLTVTCNKCSAELQIENGVKFVTCNSCKSSLEIVRTTNAIYTKVLKSDIASSKIASNVSKEQMNKSEIYLQIELLEREWNNEQNMYMEKGTLPYVNHDMNMIGGIFGIIFVFVLIMVIGSSAPQMIIFGIIILLSSVFGLANYSNRRNRFMAAQKKYKARKAELLAKIQGDDGQIEE